MTHDEHPPTTNPVVDHETGNMSDKLRDAAEVAENVLGEMALGNDRRAAAVIEADRQATRAALVSEIVAWLRENSTPHNDIDEWADEIEAKWGKQ